MRTRVFVGVILAALVFTTHTLDGQQPATSSPSTAPPTSQPSCLPPDRLLPGRAGVVTGLVVSERGQLRNGIMVRLTRYPTSPPQGTPPGAAAETKYAETDADARFTFEGLTTDCYGASIAGDAEPPSGGARFALPADAGVNLHLVTPVGRPLGLLLLGIALFVYVVGVLAFRHHNIVRTNRELLRAQLTNIRTRIPFESDENRKEDAEALNTRLDELLTNINKGFGFGRISEFFFWSRGEEIATWNELHEVERQLIAFLVPESRVLERAVTAEASLRELKTAASIVLADRIRLTLAQIMAATREGADHVPENLLEHLKQQLAEGLTMLYDDSDTKFAGLMEWHNKAMWLVYLSLLVIAVIAIGFRHEDLFLIGAAGGLMSRMARTLFREDVPSDYGASWTTLFLSPLLGAISAWFGVALIMWLTEMQVLGEAFERISWCDSGGVTCGKGDPVLIAIAFTLGFSERLFTSLLSAVETRMDSGLKGGTSAPAPPPAPVTSSGIAGGAATVSGGAGPIGTSAAKAIDLILSELDVTKGERVAIVGGGNTALRTKLGERAGAENVFEVAVTEIAAKKPLDAVLIDGTTSPLTVAELNAAAQQIPDALRDNGRVVIVARTPAGLFEADAAILSEKDQVGPTLAKERLANESSSLVAQEPATALGGTDPVEWLASFVKRARDGADR